MPKTHPVPGETWAMQDNGGKCVEGVVADVTPTAITLVSTTGHRSRISPQSLLSYWFLARPVPNTGLTCERGRCQEGAIFRTVRDGLVYHICARHAPIGTILDRLDGLEYVQLQEGGRAPDLACKSCLMCGNADVTEDMSIARALSDPWRWWSCILCDSIWMTLPPIREAADLPTLKLALRHVESKGSKVEAVHVGAGAQMLAEGYRTTLEPDLKPDDVRLRLSRKARSTLRPPMPVHRLGGRPASDEAPQTTPEVWRNHLTRQMVEVTRMDEAVHFRPVGSRNGALTMLKEDFVRFHEPHQEEPLPEVAVGEEWESEDGIYRVTAIDGKAQVIYLANPFGMRRIEFRAFREGRWSRAERKTAFDMLMED